jgi:hypothetical protein
VKWEDNHEWRVDMDLEVLILAHLRISPDIRAHKVKKNDTPYVLDSFQIG